jgi:hypothetical protein
MEWCHVCQGQYVQWAVVSQLEPNARRSRALQDYADVVTKHVCTNRICSHRWYECDHSCGKNCTRHTQFSHPYVLRRHMNRYHNNSNKNTVPTCRNVTMEEEPVNDTCMQYDKSLVVDSPQSTDAPTVTIGITLETIIPHGGNALLWLLLMVWQPQVEVISSRVSHSTTTTGIVFGMVVITMCKGKSTQRKKVTSLFLAVVSQHPFRVVVPVIYSPGFCGYLMIDQVMRRGRR